MRGRRGETDALLPVQRPRWLVVRDRFSRVLESQPLAPRVDLRAAMEAERERRSAAGWAVEEIPRNCSFFFCDRENDRVCVSVECYEPGSTGSAHWPRRR